MPELEEELRRTIRSIPDYPNRGVVFKDLTTLWKDPELTRKVTLALLDHCVRMKPDKIVGVEARGFIVGAPLADRLGVGFVPARKLGKLPAAKVSTNYQLEYGKEGLEMHSDAVSRGERAVVVDDLLATGGTAQAAKTLVEQVGGKVAGFAFVAELTFLRGREKLSGYDVVSLIRYDQE